MSNIYFTATGSTKQCLNSVLIVGKEDFIRCFPHLKDKIPSSLEIRLSTSDIQAAVKDGTLGELYKRVQENAISQGAKADLCHVKCALQMHISHEQGVFAKQAREIVEKSRVKIRPTTRRACLTSGLFDSNKWCRREIDRAKAAMVIAAKKTAAFTRRCCVRAYHACNRLTSNRSYSSFAVASSPVGSDSGGDDGGGSGDGDGQSDSHHVGIGHEARVNVVVDFQQNKSIEEPGIAARSDALAVAGFFVPFERKEAAGNER
ncbi:hypothetical protein [Pyramidobacter porci]